MAETVLLSLNELPIGCKSGYRVLNGKGSKVDLTSCLKTNPKLSIELFWISFPGIAASPPIRFMLPLELEGGAIKMHDHPSGTSHPDLKGPLSFTIDMDGVGTAE